MKSFILLFSLSILVTGCKHQKDPYESISATNTTMENEHPGKALMEKNCYLCHSPSADHDNRIAPPMIAIKKHYINSSTTKDEFKKAMQAWIKNPLDSMAKMRGAVRRFGLMPKAFYPEETIDQISEYLYDYEIEQPDWFEDHTNKTKRKQQGKKGNNQKHGNGKGKQKQMRQQMGHQTESDKARGLRYALGTKAVLGQNLMSKIQKEGTLGALSFCNERAYPLTDSMATHFKASIKRVSDNPRNPQNKANPKELNYIKIFEAQLANNMEIEPLTEEQEGMVHVYYPITTNSMCLQCHGQPQQDIQPATLDRLKQLYPEDKAVGYKVNDVRGIWHITFDKTYN